MQHTLNCPPLVFTPDVAATPTFTVVIAYEDLETGKHAKRTYDFLVENLGRDYSFVNQMWKFEVLSIPKLREIAAEDAARSDIVIISSHGSELPGQVKSWIDSWMGEASKPLALVALFDRPWNDPAQTEGVRRYLAELAKRGGMEFFAQQEPSLTNRNSKSEDLLPKSSPLTGRALSALAGVIDEAGTLPAVGN